MSSGDRDIDAPAKEKKKKMKVEMGERILCLLGEKCWGGGRMGEMRVAQMRAYTIKREKDGIFK